MEKSSSSLKRKRSKKLSKAKVSSRSKKSRKNKSKKVLRREVSLSSYDDSRSLDTSASSSSDDSYRRKRDRSRTRKDEKGRKRKSHGRSSSYHRDSSEDSHYARKKKKAKRKKERGEVRKKLSKKKNIRREASVDLMSDKSQSCSTCQYGSASSDDNRDKKKRGRSERKEKDRRLRRRSRSERSSRYRARSSSCSSEATKEKYAGEKKSRQLRSIITVTKEAEEYGELCGNETREEIANDLDYPYRSDDNNDGGTRRQLDLYTHLASEEKLSVDNEAGDMNVDLNFVEPGLRDRSYSDNSNVKAYSAGTSESAKETSETFGANVNDDDLEKILRQRALENLRKFRGEMQSSAKAPDQKSNIISQVKQPIADKRELVQGKSVVNNAVVGTKFVKRTDGEETNLFVGRRNLVACLGNNDVILDTNKDISTSAKCDLASARDKVIDSHNHSGTITESTNCNTTNLELTKQTQSPCHDSFLSHKSSNAKLLGTEGDVERNAAKTPQAAIQSINNIRDDDVSSAENKSNKLQVESNNGSQFEKKTMNVMRDGEMVQVSYKVYIPNKVPALARRQLKR